MTLKYWIDEHGNISSGKCQIGKLGEVLYNPELQSLDIPPKTDDTHIPKVVNGKWEIIELDKHKKKVDDLIVNKTRLELMRDIPDEYPKPKGYKIEEDSDGILSLIEMTDDEKISSGDYTAEELYEINLNKCYGNRRAAYQLESDGLFFDYQRGECAKSVWESKVAEIKQRYPKP
jgi:hypothetical protein